MSDPVTRTRAVVHGRVQGVWFRASTQQTARELGLTGWVRNLPDGGVEAVFEGSRSAVEAAVDWTRIGPPHAYVEQVDIFAEEPEGLVGFDVR